MKLSRPTQLQPINDSPGSTSSLDSPPSAFPSVRGFTLPKSPIASPQSEHDEPDSSRSAGLSDTADGFGKFGGIGGNAGTNSKAAAALKMLRSSSPVENNLPETNADTSDMGFVPSFFSADRQPRSRRSGANPGPRTTGLFGQSKLNSSSSNSEPIDELDRMLSNSSKPRIVSDPFASVSIPAIAQSNTSSASSSLPVSSATISSSGPQNARIDRTLDSSSDDDEIKEVSVRQGNNPIASIPVSAIAASRTNIDDSSESVGSTRVPAKGAVATQQSLTSLQDIKLGASTSTKLFAATSSPQHNDESSYHSSLTGLPALDSASKRKLSVSSEDAPASTNTSIGNKPATLTTSIGGTSGKSVPINNVVRRKKTFDFDSDSDEDLLDVKGIVREDADPISPPQKPILSQKSALPVSTASSLGSSNNSEFRESGKLGPTSSSGTSNSIPLNASSTAVVNGVTAATIISNNRPLTAAGSSGAARNGLRISAEITSQQAPETVPLAARSTPRASFNFGVSDPPNYSTGFNSQTEAKLDPLETSSVSVSSPPQPARRVSGNLEAYRPLSGGPSTPSASAAVTSSPAWLSNPIVSTAQLESSLEYSTDNKRNEAATIRKMQLAMETQQLKGEAVERQLRIEIDSLKSKLAASSSSKGALNGTSMQNDFEASVNFDTAAASTPTTSLRQGAISETNTPQSKAYREVSDLRRMNAQLEAEIARLKDEATLQLMRHREELKQVNLKRDADQAEVERRKTEEVALIEKRHSDTILALKAIHKEEIDSIKERMKDGAIMDKLSSQIQSASGSIRLIEEELNIKFRGLDAAKQGQLEARERLLAEMEETARHRAEAAEAEGYRLKGLLIHMEHVVGSLRSQGAEEKERLRQEHQRLESMQGALEFDRAALQKRISDEMQMIKSKTRELEAESHRLASERLSFNEQQASMLAEHEARKAEFQALVVASSKAADESAEKLKAEDSRLKSIRESLSKEKLTVDLSKKELQREIAKMDQYREHLVQLQQDFANEKQAVAQTARQLQAASQALQDEGSSLDQREEELRAREAALAEGMAAMQKSAHALTKREAQILEGIRHVELQQAQLERVDNDMLEKKLSIASLQRAALSQQAKHSRDKGSRWMGTGLWNGGSGSMESPLDLPNPPLYSRQGNSQNLDLNRFSSGGMKGDSIHPPSEVASPNASSSSWLQTFQAQLNSTAGYQYMVKQNLSNDPAARELIAAQEAIRNTRESLRMTGDSQIQRKQFLDKEQMFLETIDS